MNPAMKRLLLSALCLLCLCATHLHALSTTTPTFVEAYSRDPQCKQWVDSVMNTLSLKERVGQLFIYTIAPQQNKANMDLLRKVVKEYKVGGLLFSGGQAANQAILTNKAQEMAEVPLMITFDGEWGLAMRLKEIPAYPRNMVLGCIADDNLIYEYGREMARQCKELGVHVNFAPVADVNINPKNPVINTRSFGESPQNVARKVTAYGRGLEAGGVLSVCKHFPGHGDTEVDSHKSLPTIYFSRERLDSVELYPFKQAIAAGLGGIMVGHLSVPAIDHKRGVPSSLSRNVVTGLLTDELQFKGLIFTDALAMQGAQHGNSSICLKALQAGNDQLLVPRRLKEELEAVMQALKQGSLSTEVIDAKCRKVLTFKYAMGLKQRPHICLSGLPQRLYTDRTRQLIDRLNQAAVTVVSNRGGLLPFGTDRRPVAVVSTESAAELQPLMEQLKRYVDPTLISIPSQPTATHRTRIEAQLKKFGKALLCIGSCNAQQRQFLSQIELSASTVGVSFTSFKELSRQTTLLRRLPALIQAHSTHAAAQRQVAELLYGNATTKARISAGIGDVYASGSGCDLGGKAPAASPEDFGMSSQQLRLISDIAQEGIEQGAYPACEIAIYKDGHEVYNQAFGTEKGRIYDLASLSKTTGTLLAVMKLYDKGAISLTDRVGDLLPALKGTNKQNITVKELLFHQSGLPASILFYLEAIDKESYPGTLFKAKRDSYHRIQIAARTWANSHYKYKTGLTSPVATGQHTVQVSDSLWIKPEFADGYLQQIADAPLRDKRYRYSCVGFIVLQKIVEACTGMDLNAYLQQEFYRPMQLTHTGYRPLTFAKKEEIIPSSTDKFLRHTTLQGHVHDESAAFQGGISGNAGLFSTATEVAAVYQMLLNGGEYNGQRYLSPETCRLFTTTTSGISRRGLGFDKPDRRNIAKSPCCEEAPAGVYGHTGFTGTCAWADPDNGLVMVFLSNRTYPRAWNPLLMRLDIRTRVQQAMYQALLKGQATK